MADELKSDLESFREQWKAEVTSKKTEATTASTSQQAQPASPKKTRRRPRPPTAFPDLPADKEPKKPVEEESSDDEPAPNVNRRVSIVSADGQHDVLSVTQKAATALECYEKAVQKEEEGDLTESLKLYRRAFKLDDEVDKLYRDKHYPPTNGEAPAYSKSTAHHQDRPALSINDLISSFAGLHFERAPPIIEGDIPPPCPISNLPDEILVHILIDTAILDFASFMRLNQVCKKFAYLVSTDDSIWKRICLGPEIGFTGMHFSWQMTISGDTVDEGPEDEGVSFMMGRPTQQALAAPAEAEDGSGTSTPLPPLLPSHELSKKYPTYTKMFRYRPRIRFNGCYISTVNYARPGVNTDTNSLWGAPVHIVTYYRYLRFFRSGAVLSLLTTHKPADVVRELVPSLLTEKPPPTSTASLVLRGRWKLGGDPDKDSGDEKKEQRELDENALTVETEGCIDKYVYRMEFFLKGHERGRPKLVWKDFWNFNRTTEDWAEFGLRNGKPFVFSRVKAYGMGA